MGIRVLIKSARVGKDYNGGEHRFIESRVMDDDNVTIKNRNMLSEGVTLQDGGFIGPTLSLLMISILALDVYRRLGGGTELKGASCLHLSGKGLVRSRCGTPSAYHSRRVLYGRGGSRCY